jgi:hypothetical protein
MTPDMAGEVMEQLKWVRRASAVFRKMCKGWRDAHDQSVTRLTVSLPGILMTRFPRVKDIGVRLLPHIHYTAHPSIDGQWLRTLAGFTALTSLNLVGCREVSDCGMRALAGLIALTSLNLARCFKLTNGGFRELSGLTALTCLDLSDCWQVSDDGMRAVANQINCPHRRPRRVTL